jgi:ankyrin repeat protein
MTIINDKIGANCNLMTSPLGFAESLSSPEEESVFNQTPLHLAILGRHEPVIEVILSHHDRASKKGDVGSALMMPNLNIKNSKDQTPLYLAIQLGLHSVAQMLINAGASVDECCNGFTLLHQAIINGDSEGAKFLLNHGSDININTPDGEPSLLLAVKHQLVSVVEELCAKGSDVNIVDKEGNCILWTALQMENEDIASILVQYQCDTNCWSAADDGCWQTLLHRALDENNEKAASFLIRCGCDINSPRKPSPEGLGQEDIDGQTPVFKKSFLIDSNLSELLLINILFLVTFSVWLGFRKCCLHIIRTFSECQRTRSGGKDCTYDSNSQSTLKNYSTSVELQRN